MKYYFNLMKYPIALFFISLCACTNPKESKKVMEAPRGSTYEEKSIQDTVIVYDINEVSSEGATADVYYKNGNIDSATIEVYGETGQTILSYRFKGDHIAVIEKKFTYALPIGEVKTEKDMKYEGTLAYNMNYNGQLITGADIERIDIFPEFKKAVPFTLQK